MSSDSTPSDSQRKRDLSTRLIHSGSEWNQTRGITPPIVQTTTFRLDSTAHGGELALEHAPAEFYTRWGNPTSKQVEALLADLENTEEALVFSSGMGAIGATLLSLVSAGDHIVIGKEIYSGVTEIVCGVLPKFGVEFDVADSRSIESLDAALRPTTKLVFVESPTNPTMSLCDLEALGTLGKDRGVLTMVDNTFASPINQNPADVGVDIVVHAATKSLGGHSDVTAGVVCTRHEILEGCWKYLKLFGACLSPFEAWLLLRGLRTLSLRVEQQNQSALAIAEFLESHAAVEKVHYPGLESHPQHELARKQMRGFGGMIGLEIAGSVEQTARFAESLELFHLAVSLGGVESLVQHPATMTHGPLSPEERRAGGIGDGLLRFSVGLENSDDLIDDLSRALDGLA